MVASFKNMTRKEWQAYCRYLAIVAAASDKVWREDDEPTRQYPIQQEDFRDYLDRKFMYEELHKQMKTLFPREMIVLMAYYGVGTEYSFTYRQLGEFFNISFSRVQQIHAKGLRKMRHPLRSHKVKRMLEELAY